MGTSIRLLIAFGCTACGACVTGRVVDVTEASINDVTIGIESRSGVVAETTSSDLGDFRVCVDGPGEYRVVARRSGFRVRRTPSFELSKDLGLGAVEMRVNLEDAICILEFPDPRTDRNRRARFKRVLQPGDRHALLEAAGKRVVFLRGNEIWVDKRRICTHSASIWEPEFTPDGNAVRFWSTTWKDGDRQFTVPIQGR